MNDEQRAKLLEFAILCSSGFKSGESHGEILFRGFANE